MRTIYSMKKIHEILRENIKDINDINKLFEYICEKYLTKKQQKILKMHSIDGKRYKEIAKELNSNRGTVASIFSKALKNIKRGAEKIALMKELWYEELLFCTFENCFFGERI